MKGLKALSQAEGNLLGQDAFFRNLFDSLREGIVVYEALDDGEDFLILEVNPAAEGISLHKREDAIGKRVLEAFPSVGAFGFLEVFQRVWRSGEPGHLPMAEFQEGEFAGWLECAVYKLSTGEIAAVFSDVTARKRVQDELRRQRELLVRIIEALDHPFYVVNTADYRVELANSAARNLAGNSPVTTCHALTHTSDLPCDEDCYPCPLKEVLRTREPVVMEHLHFDADGKKRTLEVHAFPLADDQGNITRMIEYTQDITDRKSAELAARESLAAAERERLAQELHDSVTQSIFSASIMAETLSQVLELDSKEGRMGAEELHVLTRGALAEMRSLLVELRPVGLTEKPLARLMENMVQAMGNRLRLPVTLQIENAHKLPPEVQIALYRITQEALNNVAKHAQAKNVTIHLAGSAEDVELQIADDGHGFAAQDVLPDRMGLSIMRERAEGIGARLAIRSGPGMGTQVDVAWAAGQSEEA